MTLDPMTERCARLLWEGYKAADRIPIVQLDGFVADAAGMPFGTLEYNTCINQLARTRGAIVEESAWGGGIAGATFYRITEDGLELLRKAGHLPA